MTKKKINDEQILALCAIRPMCIGDMAAAIDAKPQSMCRYLPPLISSGQLEITSPPSEFEGKGRRPIYYKTVPLGNNAKAVIEDGKLLLKSTAESSVSKEVVAEKINQAKAEKANKTSAVLLESIQEQLVEKIASRVVEQLSGVIATLGEQIAAQVLQRVSASFAAQSKPSSSSESTLKEKKEDKPQVSKVGVVGLLPIQTSALERDFKGIPLEFCFWKDNGINRLKGLGAGCEKVFVHVGHISHNAIEVLKSAGASIEYVNGGKSNMKAAIERYMAVKQ